MSLLGGQQPFRPHDRQALLACDERGITDGVDGDCLAADRNFVSRCEMRPHAPEI